jgi:hypothetical protein
LRIFILAPSRSTPSPPAVAGRNGDRHVRGNARDLAVHVRDAPIMLRDAAVVVAGTRVVIGHGGGVRGVEVVVVIMAGASC